MTDKPTRVFVIDDDDAMRRSLRDLLESLGYDVETFASAEQFLARKPFQGVGCIILDVRMPGLSGLDLQERLIQTEHPLPIVFVTGYGDLPMGVDAMKKGPWTFCPSRSTTNSSSLLSRLPSKRKEKPGRNLIACKASANA